MPTDSEHHRRSVRLPAYDYASPGAYFVTLVTQHRACLFGAIHDGVMVLSPRGRIAEECWRAIPAHFPHVELGTFIVMPNHVHGILILHERVDENNQAGVAPAVGTNTLPSQVGATHWVAPTTGADIRPRPHGPSRGSLGAIVGAFKMAVTRAIGRTTWQRGYYEHVIRDERDWDRTRRYIETNPLTWDNDEENVQG